MARLDLYYQTQLESKVSLLPEQVDADMDDHLLENLRMKVEGKAIDSGIVLKVNRLIDYNLGIIDKANFMGTTVYTVKYECFLCSPVQSLEMIGIIDVTLKGYLIAKNGPVTIALQYNHIDPQNFEIVENNVVYVSKKDNTKTPVKIGDYIKASVINIKNNPGESSIMAFCKLINMASKEEINKFKEDQTIITGEILEGEEKEFF